MERFVQAIVGGGLCLLAGLWLLLGLSVPGPDRILGAILVLVGLGGLGVGIASELNRPIQW